MFATYTYYLDSPQARATKKALMYQQFKHYMNSVLSHNEVSYRDWKFVEALAPIETSNDPEHVSRTCRSYSRHIDQSLLVHVLCVSCFLSASSQATSGSLHGAFAVALKYRLQTCCCLQITQHLPWIYLTNAPVDLSTPLDAKLVANVINYIR